jgi:hypothetical protein
LRARLDSQALFIEIRTGRAKRGPFCFCDHGTREKFFIIFVDAMFTTLLKPLFTSTFDVIAVKRSRGCLCRARHAD